MAQEKYLVVNGGSSSLKFALYSMPEEKELINGYVEKIGLPDCFWNVKINGQKIKNQAPLKNHSEAVEVMMKELINHKVISDVSEIKGVGHRVVHGGEKYADSVIIDDKVISDIESLTKFAKLHHPGNLAGIKAMKEVLPTVPMVAVFDTAFHQTMPKTNYMYPLPMEWYEKYGVRKYGFHGTSHKYITGVMQEKLGKEDVNLIICHVGSGASISAIKNGKCFDTTMGLTPVDGLMMGTRCGSIDPSITEYMVEEAGLTIDEVSTAYNKKSGLLGVCGFNDNRDVEKAIAEGNENAKLALDMYINRIVRYIAEYYVELEGKVDAIAMTAGVLENGCETREAIIDKLACFGLKVNKEVNDKIAGFKDVHEGIITTSDSKIPVYVVPTDEEIMIIKDTYRLINE